MRFRAPRIRFPGAPRRPLAALAFALLLLPALAGCYWRIAREPMPFVVHGNLGPERARGAIVLLPGFGDEPADLERSGFVPILRRRAPGYDVVAADAHFGYYKSATLLAQLHASVIGPLVARGYRELWIAGVSMGGHGAVAYARAFPERVRGLLLFAPYLGPGDVVRDVTQAGGICHYRAPHPPEASRNGFAQANFAWLKDVFCEQPPKVSLWVAVGDQDIGASGLLAQVIAPEQYLVLPGRHDWAVWNPALERIAERAFAPPPSAGRRPPAGQR